MLYRLVHEPIGLNSCIPLQFPDYPAWLWLLFQRWQQLGQPFFFSIGTVNFITLFGDVWRGKKKLLYKCRDSSTIWKNSRTMVYDKYSPPPNIDCPLHTVTKESSQKRIRRGKDVFSRCGKNLVGQLTCWNCRILGTQTDIVSRVAWQ